MKKRTWIKFNIRKYEGLKIQLIFLLLGLASFLDGIIVLLSVGFVTSNFQLLVAMYIAQARQKKLKLL